MFSIFREYLQNIHRCFCGINQQIGVGISFANGKKHFGQQFQPLTLSQELALLILFLHLLSKRQFDMIVQQKNKLSSATFAEGLTAELLLLFA